MRHLSSLLFLAALAFADVVVLDGARIHTVTNGTIERGTIVVEDGRIKAVGKQGEVAIPDGATVRDCAGLVVIPGLVDTHSHLGVYSRPGVIANSDGNEMTGPVQSLVRALDSIHPKDPGIRLARAGGVTTANIMPGSGNVMGGQTAYVKLRGKTVEDMLIDLAGGPGGMKMANGENPKRSYGQRRKLAPGTRMKVMALQREIFTKAQRYKAERAKGEGGRKIELDPVVEILDRKRTVHFHTHRADDILSALRLSKEFGFEVVLHHVTEAFLVGKEIAKRDVAVSLTLVDSPGGKPEAINLDIRNPAWAEKLGVEVALNTDDPVTESRFFLRTAALAVRGGLSIDSALKAITIRPARMMHLDKRVGSIEAGKDADLVLLSGEPFSTYTHVLATWIEGELLYDRARERDLRDATGGYYVRDRIKGRYAMAAKPPAAKAPDGGVPAAVERFAVRAGVLFTGERTIHDGVVVVDKGKIVSVGEWTGVRDMPVFAAPWVTPGFIDAHASAGLSGAFNVHADQDLQESSEQNQAALRAVDGFNARERLVRFLLGYGVTIVHAVPGPATTIAGQSGVFRTYADTTAAATLRAPAALVFNLGETPKSERGKEPGTRMGIAAFLRKALSEAREPRPEKDKGEVDLNRESLAAAVRGELPVMFVAHREDDLMTALRIAKEFGLKATLSQATEGYLVAERLRAAGIGVAAAPTMQRAGDLQRFNTNLENAARMADAGIRVAITSGYESYVPKTRVILFEAQVAAANGLGWERALKAITLEPARLLGIDKERGSLAPGKSADLVLFDGDPLEYASHATHVYAEGKLVYTR